MSNLAYQVQQQQVQRQLNSPMPSVKQQTRGITKGEKVLWTMASLLLLAGTLWLITNYATVYTSSLANQHLQKTIAEETKQMDDIKLQVTELSAPDRILNIAKQHGFILNDKNVKVIQQN